VASHLTRADQQLLAAVEAAIQRLSNQPATAGVCQSAKCLGNGVIESERLGCFPETRICSVCARDAESKRVLPHVRKSSGTFSGRRR
jgi:predicted Rdx family selenoprotein